MGLRHLFLMFLLLVGSKMLLGEVTSHERRESSEEARELTCEETFARYSCQDLIDKSGGSRNDFLDCTKKQSLLKATTTCSAHLALGAGVTALTLAAPAVVLPIVGGLVTYNALKSEQACFHDIGYKKKVVRPLAALHSEEYANTLARRLSCHDLERIVVSSLKAHSGQIFEKEQNQKRFEKELAKRPDQRSRLERLYPIQKRRLTSNEKKYKAALEEIKSEENEWISTVEKINKNYRCASLEKKVKIFCEVLGGGVAGGGKLASGLTKKHQIAKQDIVQRSESSMGDNFDNKLLSSPEQSEGFAARNQSLEKQGSVRTEVVSLAIGEKVKIAGRSTTVKKFLGDGEEGDVFLVEDQEGRLFALKAFRKTQDLKENRETLEKMRTYLGDDSVIDILGMDEAKGHLLLEYVKGRELSEFLIDPNLSPQVKMRAQILFEELQRKARMVKEREPVDLNVFVRDSDSSLVVIDPY